MRFKSITFSSAEMPKPSLLLYFESPLIYLLRHPSGKDGQLVYRLLRRASIKDIVEALGVPHSEVWAILSNNAECTFDTVPQAGETFKILALSPDHPVTEPTVLRPEPLTDLRFLVDINVNKLGRLLRLTGYDAEPVPNNPLRDIAIQAAAKKRILLTRNRDLLKYKEVIFGYLVRSHEPEQQYRELVELYSLDPLRAPFSRCLECNGLLMDVEKSQVVDRLEPLTKKYYRTFKECPECDLIFWRGSHHQKMTELLARLADPRSKPIP